MLKSLKKLSSQNKKRLGRGISAGQGKTAGRGTKGQKSRSGYNIPRKFEGGQMPFSMRMPKVKGFKSQSKDVAIISLDTISANFKSGDKVTIEKLIEKKLAKKGDSVKVLNNGKLTVSITFEVPCSKSLQTEEPEKEIKKTGSNQSEIASKGPRESATSALASREAKEVAGDKDDNMKTDKSAKTEAKSMTKTTTKSKSTPKTPTKKSTKSTKESK